MLTIIALCFAIGLVSAAHKVAWTHDDPHFHKVSFFCTRVCVLWRARPPLTAAS